MGSIPTRKINVCSHIVSMPTMLKCYTVTKRFARKFFSFYIRTSYFVVKLVLKPKTSVAMLEVSIICI